jgi:hypothetical protein
MASPEWAAKRRQALAQHGAFCRGCGRHQLALHVHHRTYDRLGAEPLADLVILCETCHDGVHRLVSAGVALPEATDRVVDARPSQDSRVTVDFVPLNLRAGYVTPRTSGRAARLNGLPIVAAGKKKPEKRDADAGRYWNRADLRKESDRATRTVRHGTPTMWRTGCRCPACLGVQEFWERATIRPKLPRPA